MRKRFILARVLSATAIMVAGGGVVAALSTGPAGAVNTPPKITVVTSHTGSGLPTLGHPKTAAAAGISADFIAEDASNTNGDSAVVVDATGAARVFLIAGANESNEYNIQTAPGTEGSLVKGDAYLVAGLTTGSITMRADPGASTVTRGGSSSVQATSNGISPTSVTFDNSGNLLIAEAKPVTNPTETGIQEVAKASCSSCTDPYGYANQAAGGLYTVAGTGGWDGVTRGPAIINTTSDYGFAISVDAQTDIVDGGQGEVFFLNEQSGTVHRYARTITSKKVVKVAGTTTAGTATCGGGNVGKPATGSASSPFFNWPHPYIDSAGDIYINDNAKSTHSGHGCTWVLPATNTSESLDGIAMTGGDVYSLTGATNTSAFVSGHAAKTTAFPATSEVTLDSAGNLVLTLSGTSPAVEVVAESSGTYYHQTMHAGDVYLISGGAGASGTGPTAAGYEFSSVARTTTVPQYGMTSLTHGPAAGGDLYLTDGASASSGTAYEITSGPTGPPSPSVTSVTPTSGHVGGGIVVTVHGTNLTGISKVKFGGVTGSTVTFVNSTEVTAKDPAHGAATVTVSVTATLGTGSKATAFTYIAPTTTHITFTISGTRYKGTKLHLVAHVTPTTAPGTVTFDTTDPTPIATCTGLTVTSGVASCTDTLSTTGAHKIVAHFTPANSTNFAASTSSGTTNSGAFTVTTRPTTGGTVRQPIQLTVAAGRLTLSCTRYATVETPPTITSPALGAAIKTCPIIVLPKVQLNGVQQTRTSVMNPIYVFTARGTATAGWSLSAAMVPTVADATDGTLNATSTTAPHVAGTPAHESITVSSSCAAKADFCDETGTLGATQKHGNIPASDLTLSNGYTCTPAATNHNPTPATKTSGAFGTGYTTSTGTFTGRTLSLCTAAAGTSGGKFKVSGGKFTLTIPSIIRHGKYFGTVEYSLVSVA